MILIGLKPNSEVKIFLAGTSTELGSVMNSGTDFTYSYTYSPGVLVDIIIIHLNYNYYRIEDYPLSATDSSIPIQQIIDRVYSNPA